MLDAVDEAAEQQVGLGGGVEVGHPPQQLAEHDRHLAPGQVGAQAEVRPRPAEGHVLVGGAADVEAERVVEVVSRYTEAPVEQVTLAATFEELAIDSMDGLGLIADLEEAFDVIIPNDEALGISTVQEAVESLHRHVENKAARDEVAEGDAP